MSIMRRLSMPTQSGEFGPIRHNKSEHLRGCLKLSFKTDLICGETGIDRHTHVYFTRLNTMACVSVEDFSCSCWKSHICFHRDDRLKVKPPCHSLLNLCQHCWHLCFKESSHNQYCSHKNIYQMTTSAPLCGFVELRLGVWPSGSQPFCLGSLSWHRLCCSRQLVYWKSSNKLTAHWLLSTKH